MASATTDQLLAWEMLEAVSRILRLLAVFKTTDRRTSPSHGGQGLVMREAVMLTTSHILALQS